MKTKKFFASVVLILFLALGLGQNAVFADQGWKIRPPEAPQEQEINIDPLASFFNFGAQKNELADISDNPALKEILELINKYYVEKSPDKEKMLEGALNGILQSLDPHSVYLNPERTKNEKEEMITGEFAGIGARLEMKGGYVIVVSIFENSPAEKAGLKAGDAIIKVKDEDGEITINSSLTLLDVVKKIRGKIGTKIQLTVSRQRVPGTLKIEITRGAIKIINTAAKTIGDVGYIKLNSFTNSSPKEISSAIEKLKNNGAKKLILDLRNNGGGLLNAANDIATMFLPAGKIITSLKGRGEKLLKTRVSGGGKYSEIPLVVLTNGYSASASEILAAAIKENGRGKIIGETTFGIGSVQSVITLSNGGSIHLTTAKFYSPNGNVIHEKGVSPDVEVKIENPDNFKMGDQKNDAQLAKAMELLVGSK
ncbi:MAG: S41 family peptidase [Patescibacteria group bacterium]